MDFVQFSMAPYTFISEIILFLVYLVIIPFVKKTEPVKEEQSEIGSMRDRYGSRLSDKQYVQSTRIRRFEIKTI